MDWMAIVSAVFLVAMIAYLFPRAKHMLQNSPEASSNEWMSALIPLALVGVFIALLVAAL